MSKCLNYLYVVLAVVFQNIWFNFLRISYYSSYSKYVISFSKILNGCDEKIDKSGMFKNTYAVFK